MGVHFLLQMERFCFEMRLEFTLILKMLRNLVLADWVSYFLEFNVKEIWM